MQRKIAAIINNRETAVKDALLAKKQGADILELRLDLLGLDPERTIKLIRSLKRKIKLPLIATIRLKSEGGKFPDKMDKSRLDIFKQLIPHVDYIDIELTSKIAAETAKLANKNSRKVIVSYHNFDRTPASAELKNIILKSLKLRPFIIKVASNIIDADDFLKLALLLLDHSGKANISIIPMSKKPDFKAFRLLSSGLGSCLSYAFLGKSIAPGQISLREHSEFIKSCLY